MKYGKNKEHDPLPQMNLALLFGEQSNLSVYYRKLPGNISDVQKQLFQRYTMQGLLDELDVIECYERPGHELQFGEITKRQIELYDALGVPSPTSL
nr:hypothetical protein [Paenibacillus donghaensis]